MSTEATNLQELRAQARQVRHREPVERRVYNLPTELLARVVQFQIKNNLPSEVAAVRILLNDALSEIEARRAKWRIEP